MATPVSTVIERFLSRIRSFDFLNYLEEELDSMTLSYLKSSIGSFQRLCKSDLTITEDNEFVGDLSEEEIDILVEGMIIEWIKPYLYRSDNLKDRMNTKDYSFFSPANLLKEIRSTYTELQAEHAKAIRMYSYTTSVLYDLSVSDNE